MVTIADFFDLIRESLMTVSALIFDLGNVLIDIDFDRVFQSWGQSLGRPVEEIRDSFHFDEAYERHERGQISGEVYLNHLRDSFQLSLTFADFIKGWNEVFLGESQGMAVLLDELNPQTRLLGLTNTNQLHHDEWKERYSTLFARLETIFVSSELGCRKPEPRIFETVQERLGIAKAEEVIFFDDALVNVEGARDYGWRAFQTTSCQQIREHLSQQTFLEIG